MSYHCCNKTERCHFLAPVKRWNVITALMILINHVINYGHACLWSCLVVFTMLETDVIMHRLKVGVLSKWCNVEKCILLLKQRMNLTIHTIVTLYC